MSEYIYQLQYIWNFIYNIYFICRYVHKSCLFWYVDVDITQKRDVIEH